MESIGLTTNVISEVVVGLTIFTIIWGYAIFGSNYILGRFRKLKLLGVDENQWKQRNSLSDSGARANSYVSVNKDYIRELFEKLYGILLLFPILLLPVTIPRSMMFARTFAAVCSQFFTIRAFEVFLDDRFKMESRRAKTIHVALAFHDIQNCEKISRREMRRMSLVEPGKNSSEWARIVAQCIMGAMWHLCLIFMASKVFFKSDEYTWAMSSFIRGTTGFAMGYSFLKFLDYEVTLHMLLLNYRTPKIMNDIYYSRSLGEYWKDRWDTPLQGIFYAYAYKPARKLGFKRHFSAILTFFASGLFHVYPLWIGGFPKEKLYITMCYFMLQALLIAIETKILKVTQLSVGQTKMWLLFCILLSNHLLQLSPTLTPTESASTKDLAFMIFLRI